MLDWIAQIARKAWADPACMAGLVRALDDVLHVQANLCPGGHSRTLSRARVQQLVGQALADGAPRHGGAS